MEKKEEEYTPRERLGFVWAALKAGLLLGAAYLAGLGLTVAALMFLWGVL